MATATLTTLTPVHIGNGQKLLRNFDFIIQDGKVGFIDLAKIAKLIGEDKTNINQLTRAIENKESIITFLQKGRGLNNIDLNDICYKIVPLKGFTNNNTGELKEQYFTAMKGPCIPGSSLKGSLKSGILKYLTSEKRNTEEQQKQLIGQIELQKRPDQVFSSLERTLFGNDANSKTTRFLMIGDIQFEENNREVHELSYENMRNEDNLDWEFEQKKAQLIECIPANISAAFQFKINLDLAFTYNKMRETSLINDPRKKMSPLKDLTVFGKGEIDFLKNINDSTLTILQNDHNKLVQMGMPEDYLLEIQKLITMAESSKEGEAILRVGGHSGWNYITNRWMVYESEYALTNYDYAQIRKKVQRTDRYLHMNTFPKTRKVTQEGTLLGFVKINITS